MKKLRFSAMLLLIVFSIATVSGCTLIAGKEQAYFYERPAFGFTVEEEVITDVDLKGQNGLTLSAGDGIITIVPYEGDKLQIVERRKLTGLSSQKKLKLELDKRSLKIQKYMTEITIDTDQDEKQKPLFRLTNDVELRVPKGFLLLDITAKSGEIAISGFTGMSSLKLGISKGNIEVEGCEAFQLLTDITNGNLDVGSFSGNGTYESGRGNIRLVDMKGNIELSSLSGDTFIEKAEGKLECEVSTGSLTVKSSQISSNSTLYISNGSIDADLTNLDTTGKYEVKGSKGEIKLKLSHTAGWSLLAESTKGKVTEKPGLSSGELKKAPTGELYGDVRGGGPIIDAYIDMGDITLYKQ